MTVQSWPDDKAWSKRVGDLMAKALPVLGDQIGLPWPQTGTLDGPRGGQPLDGRLRRPVRPGEGRRGDRLLRAAVRRPPRVGARLVQRLAPGGPLGERGVRVVLRAPGGRRPEDQGDRRRPDHRSSRPPGSRSTRGARSGATRARPRTTRTPRASRWPRRSANGRPPTCCRPSGPTRPVMSARTSRRRAAPPETVDGAPDWRGLLDLLETESGNRFDDLWRTWVARDEDLPLLDARTAARARYDQVVGGCRRLDAAEADPRRDARVALRRCDPDARRGERGPRPARDHRDERRGGRPDPIPGAGDGVRGR